MTTKNKVLFNLSMTPPQRIRLLIIHPKKQWIATINVSNIFTLWNYKERLVIKSFSCNTLDDTKGLQIKEMLFYDRYSLPYTHCQGSMRSAIIFMSAFKLYFYDYMTDSIKMINEKEMEQKNIRKICVYSQSKICISLSDGSFKVLDSRELYTKNTMNIKTIRGYHSKPITHLITYCQNSNDMPRVITVSSQDGLMACWNIETINSQYAAPSFKFIMQKGKGESSSNGEEIMSLQYDSSSYRLVTLTDSAITVWSTMTGMELKKLPNPYKYKELYVFNHFSFGPSTFIAHSGKAELFVVKNQTIPEAYLTLKDFIKEGDANIQTIRTLPNIPSEIVFLTSTNLLVIELDKCYRPYFGTHWSFITRLSSLNSKEFIVKNEGMIRPDISKTMLQNIIFEEDLLFNFFFLSFESGFIHFNLVEIQFQNMLHLQRRLKMKEIDRQSVLNQAQGSQTVLEVSYDGRELVLFNKEMNYFELYTSAAPQDLLGLEENEHIDFHSQLVLLQKGIARDIAWHQYKSEFIVVQGFDKAGNLVEYIPKKSSKKIFDQITTWRACIYSKEKYTSRYAIIHKTDPLATKIHKVFSLGLMFGYSNEKDGVEQLEYIASYSQKEVEGAPICPEKIFVSYCQCFHIYAYDGSFAIFKVQQNGSLSFFRTVYETIIEGLFWEKMFFFLTKNNLFFMQILPKEIVLITLASSMPLSIFNDKGPLSNEVLFDDLESKCYLLPQGQLQLVSIVNVNLIALNNLGEVVMVSLKKFPYIQFCVELVSGFSESIPELLKGSSQNVQKLMREAMQQYGMAEGF